MESASKTEQPLTMSGAELRRRIDRWGLTYSVAAERVGLTLDGLQKQMRGTHRVSRQTVIILDLLEEVERLRAARRQGRIAARG